MVLDSAVGWVTLFVINLDADHERISTLRCALEVKQGFDIVRVSGVPGKELPFTAREALSFDKAWAVRRGEIGCFLSHVKAWECVASTESPFSVVLEDDCVPENLERLNSLAIPSDADLIFINDRMSPGSRFGQGERVPKCLPISCALQVLNRGGLKQGGVGGDGYILTPKAARKLLDAVTADHFFGHVDWRLLRYGVSESDLTPEFDDTELEFVIRRHHNPNRPPAMGILKSYCLDTPLVSSGRFSSTRERQNENMTNLP